METNTDKHSRQAAEEVRAGTKESGEEASHPTEDGMHAETPTSSRSPGLKARSNNDDLLEEEKFRRFEQSRIV